MDKNAGIEGFGPLVLQLQFYSLKFLFSDNFDCFSSWNQMKLRKIKKSHHAVADDFLLIESNRSAQKVGNKTRQNFI
ncbi:MAG TPA: hypothetical protein DCQ58_07410 [Saprospirales bacterium]|nr:hypothetical protein [Saprospirales bacterium]